MDQDMLSGMTVTLILLALIAISFIFMGVQQVPDGYAWS